MPTYKKLVRDRILEIIEKNGHTYTYSILDEAAYQRELRSKLQEELQEYLDAETDKDSVEELADLIEVIYALAKIHGASAEALEAVRQQKSEARGGFEKRIFLDQVDEETSRKPG